MGMSQVVSSAQLSNEVHTPAVAPVGYKQTGLGLFPADWEIELLESVAKRGSGHTPDKKHPEYWGGTIKWISLADSERLDNVYIHETCASITPAGIANSSAVLHPPGTVVLSRDAGVGKSAIMADEMAVSQHFMAWQCGPHLHNHYLYYWLQFQKAEFERIAIGNTIKTIGLPFFKNLKVPLPPPSEQRAIAAALSDVDELIGALDKLIAKKRALKLAAMQRLLTGKARLPGYKDRWQVQKLGDLADIIDPHPSHRAPPQCADGMPFVGIGDISCEGIIRHASARLVHPSVLEEHAQRYDLNQSLVGLGRVASIGKVVRLRNDVGPYAISPTMAVVRGTAARGDYLYYYLSSPVAADQFERISNGSTRQSVGMNVLREILIELPGSVQEQASIASLLLDMDREIEAQERRRDKAKAIKQGMMQALITGRIRIVKPEAGA